MKSLKVLVPVFLAAVLAAIAPHTAAAQDPLKVAPPEIYKLVYENDRVRVMEVTLPPGGKIAKHSHPDHYVYVLGAGNSGFSRTMPSPWKPI